jgi:uncharacterized membrane protein
MRKTGDVMHTSTKVLLGEVAAVAAAAAIISISGYPLLFSRHMHRLLHILGAVLLLGNIIVSAAWMLFAERSGGLPAVRFSVVAVNWADVLFTVPGVFLLFANGDILAGAWGGILGSSWIVVSLALFVLSGVLWAGFLIRLQHRMIALARDVQGDTPPKELLRTLHQWYVGGAIATVFPVASLVIMVFKPRFW